MDDLSAIPGDLSPSAPDDDPDVTAGMERLRVLRELEVAVYDMQGLLPKMKPRGD